MYGYDLYDIDIDNNSNCFERNHISAIQKKGVRVPHVNVSNTGQVTCLFVGISYAAQENLNAYILCK